jgi:hypothetical protein
MGNAGCQRRGWALGGGLIVMCKAVMAAMPERQHGRFIRLTWDLPWEIEPQTYA